MTENLLEVKNLKVSLDQKNKTKKVLVDDISFELKKGECLGILGESGSGKSMTVKSIMGLLDKSFKIEGSAKFEDENLIGMDKNQLRKVRGDKITMILQNPMTCFDQLCRIDDQIFETFQTHRTWTKVEMKEKALDLLTKMQIPNAEEVLKKYPHQLSGGMLQRIMIGLAISMQPKLLIADEPTTAIDAITQYEILKLLKSIKDSSNMSMLYITHDLGEISFIADRILVMNTGKIVDKGNFKEILNHAKDPYTRMLAAQKIKVMNKYKKIFSKEANNA